MLAYSLIGATIVSLISLVGLFTLSLKEEVLKRYIFLLVALAVGALLGDAFIHLIPEAYETFANKDKVGVLIIIGVLFFFILERLIHWHHHHNEDEKHDDIHPTGKLVLISDGFHNLLDGMIIGSSFLVGVEVGIATTVAVALHEIPQEIGDFGILINSGFKVSRALFWNFISALFAIVGVLLAHFLSIYTSAFAIWIVPLTAGGFIYIALSDLIPELHKVRDLKRFSLQFFAIVLGVGAMLMLALYE